MKQNYREQVQKAHAQIASHRKCKRFVSLSRLLIFIGIVLWLYFSWYSAATIPVGLLMLISFFALVKVDEKLRRRIIFAEELIRYNQRELDLLEHNFQQTDGEPVKTISPDHPYAADLDLFGQKSLFALLNASASEQGKLRLQELLMHFRSEPNDVAGRQSFIKEYAPKHEMRSAFFANLKSAELSTKKYDSLKSWIVERIKPTSWYLPLMIIFSVGSLIVATLSIIGQIPEIYSLYWFLLGMAIVGSQYKKNNPKFNDLTDFVSDLSAVKQAIEILEKNRTDSSVVKMPAGSGSDRLQKLSKITDLVESRANLIVGTVLNGFFLWDFLLMYRLANWHRDNAASLSDWLTAVTDFDAYNGIAAFAMRNESFVYPALTDTGFEAKQLGHPLIPDKERVSSDFSLVNSQQFAIVTGANMAGKSTFLRTVASNMVLGMLGAPVVAKELAFKPVPLFTSMRTEDSLAEHESYFFAELKRLKAVVEQLDKGHELFIILDEILKGTNSADKAKGSEAFLEKLLTYNSRGIIATHDLSLCELEGKHPQKIVNKSFEVEFVNDQLQFDYKLRDGVCQNMNASFLLEKMGLVNKISS